MVIGEIARMFLHLTDDADELREAADVLRMHGPDEQLLGLVKKREKKVKGR